MNRVQWWFGCLAGVIALAGCSSNDAPNFQEMRTQSLSRVHIKSVETVGVDGNIVTHQLPHIRDAHDRYVHFRGINVSGSHKAPPSEEFPSLYPLPTDAAKRAECKTTVPMPADCIPERVVSYLDSPFPLDEADKWYGKLADLGFNSVRLITNWESIQPFKPGTCAGRPETYEKDGQTLPKYTDECYDLEYLDYYEQLVDRAKVHGIYVLADMHQDIFSRHLMTYYTEDPTYGDPDNLQKPEKGSLDEIILSLFPRTKTENDGGGYTDWVRGHGAPRWIVQTCLPEKKMDSPHWGIPRMVGGLRGEDGNLDLAAFSTINDIFEILNPGQPLPVWLEELLEKVPEGYFDVDETSDMLPITPWLLNGGLSLDVDRCFASLFAGDKVFPNLGVDPADLVTKRRDEVPNPDDLIDLKTYMQDAYTNAWLEVVKRIKKHDNVVGYDIMNEPVGIFLMLMIAGNYDGPDSLLDTVSMLLGNELGEKVTDLIVALNLMPPDTEPETLKRWGLYDLDTGPLLDLNMGFDAKFLLPFYERVGQAIQEEDPNAVIWFEAATSIRTLTGPQAFFDLPLTKPQGINQLVFAPHWYPDIYPRVGINSPPREFKLDEWLYRDLTEKIEEHMEMSPSWLGNVPVVFGEFGTYFNFNGIEESMATDYAISAHVLNSYYEAFEEFNLGSMVWCFAPNNDAKYGEWWNHEDFSIIGPDGEARGWPAYVRTYARATSGKMVSQHFNSQYHYWDPVSNVPKPERHYDLVMEGYETDAATEIFVPKLQYPDGFYVWVSDGFAYYDEERQILYWYPTTKKIGWKHTIHIEPWLPDREVKGWRYFFKGSDVLVGTGQPMLTGGAL